MMWKCTYKDPFLVQYEIPEPIDDRTRMYIVFNGVEEYMRYMHRYNTCHEVFISSNGWNREDDVEGHPVFDIDAPLDTLSDGWERSLEKDIEEVLCIICPMKTPEIKEVLSDSSNFVWMVSSNKEKISKHLLIRGITFSQWRRMSTVMYRLLKKNHPFIDDGIVRCAGSLRMVFNSKVGGAPLYFESDSHIFIDSLVLIHNININTIGVLLMTSDMDNSILQEKDMVYRKVELDDIDDESITAFKYLDEQYNTGLVIGPEENGYISLPRERPGRCPISGRIHDKVGGYLFSKNKKTYFGCHRKCTISIRGREYRSIDITPYPAENSESIARQFIIDEKNE